MRSSLSCSRWLISATLSLAVAAAQSGAPVTIVNAVTYTAAPLAPQTFAVAFGTFPGATLAATRVLVGDQPAQLLYVSENQINFVVPGHVSPPSARVQIQRNGTPVAMAEIEISRSAPLLFSQAGSDTHAGLILNANGSINSPSNAAAAGSQIRLYATGLGSQPRREDVGVMIGLQHIRNATIRMDPNMPGLWVIEIALPQSGLTPGLTPVAIHAGGSASNTVTLSVQ